ncbi:MAG: hypothetical protein OEW04_02465 [Nitrospirota bacterium]|nr:hypothetical protein [Nitrospirota bacterium]
MTRDRIFSFEKTTEENADGYRVDTDESLFHRAMVSIYDFILHERRYDARRFLNLLGSHGGVMTAKEFLITPGFQAGFEGLWKPGPVERTMEYLVLQPRFSVLFTEEEKDTARNRLRECGYIQGSA